MSERKNLCSLWPFPDMDVVTLQRSKWPFNCCSWFDLWGEVLGGQPVRSETRPFLFRSWLSMLMHKEEKSTRCVVDIEMWLNFFGGMFYLETKWPCFFGENIFDYLLKKTLVVFLIYGLPYFARIVHLLDLWLMFFFQVFFIYLTLAPSAVVCSLKQAHRSLRIQSRADFCLDKTSQNVTNKLTNIFISLLSFFPPIWEKLGEKCKLTVNTGQRDYPGENWTGGNPSWVPSFSVSVLVLLLSWFAFLEQCVSLDNFVFMI